MKHDTRPEAMLQDFLTCKELENKRTKLKFNFYVMMTLEERVLDFINNHPGGVRIAEMEIRFGETRMKLGFVAKNLLEKGMIQKIDLTYFPKIHSLS